MKKRILLVVLVMVVLMAGIGLWRFLRGPDLSAYDRFYEPALLSLPAQKMVVIEATGAPEAVAGEAFGALMAAYFSMDGVPKGRGMPAPRARWPQGLEVPPSQWLGRYAIPVPESVTALPAAEPGTKLVPKLVTWDYGDIAQVLHVGPYHAEKPSIDRLQLFIAKQGLKIVGEHEEEYLRGPGMFGKGDPEKYYTLIRYRVAKKDS